MEKHLSRRERKKYETRHSLMQAALRLFKEQGYDDTTIEQITEAADVAKGTFFNYFETKEAILPALAGWRLRQLEDALLIEEGAPESPIARIKMALCLIADDPLSDPLLMKRLFTAIENNRSREDVRPGHAMTKLLIEQVQQAQTAGEIRADLDPIQIGGAIRALFFQQIMTWYHGCRPCPLPHMLRDAIDLLLDGVGGPRWRENL